MHTARGNPSEATEKRKTILLAHGRGTTLASILLGGLGFLDTLGENLGILGLKHIRFETVCEVARTYSSILSTLSIATLECDTVTLVLKTLRSDQTLNLRSLGVWLLAFTLGLDLTTDNELTDLENRAEPR